MGCLLLIPVLGGLALAQAPKYEFAKAPIKDGPFVHLSDAPAQIHVAFKASEPPDAGRETRWHATKPSAILLIAVGFAATPGLPGILSRAVK